MSQLRAAADQVDLQPVIGARLTGFANRLEPSTGSHDPLLAKLLLLDDGATRLLWVACDLIGFSLPDAARLRGMTAQQIGVAPANVLVSCTHTHSGPSSMPFRGKLAQVDQSWLSRVFDSIAKAGNELHRGLRPARIIHGTKMVAGLGYNRQDGVSPIEERVVVVSFLADDGQTIATILNYATHPVVLGERNLLFSADYPGYAARAVESAIGGVGMFVLGAAGDVDPMAYRDQGRQAGTFEIAQQMGERLAAAAVDAIAGAEARSDLRITTAETTARLPLDPPPTRDDVVRMKAELLARVGPAGALPATNEGRWAMFELAWVNDLEQAMSRDAVPRFIDVRIAGARIGDVFVLSFPFELYSQIGLDIRSQAEPRSVIIAGYTNGLVGYAPTDRAKDQGGYGPAMSHRFFPELLTALGRGSDAALVRAGSKLIAQLDD